MLYTLKRCWVTLRVQPIMGFPIRCFTCGKVIAHLYEEYETRSAEEDPYLVLDEMKIGRPCCRRMFTTHVDIERFAIEYPTYPGRIQRIGPKFAEKVSDEDSEEELEDEEEPEEDAEPEDDQNLEEEPEDVDSEQEEDPEGDDEEDPEGDDEEEPEDEEQEFEDE